MRICRDRSTGKLVAVKKLRKSEMVRRGQVSAAQGRRAAGTRAGEGAYWHGFFSCPGHLLQPCFLAHTCKATHGATCILPLPPYQVDHVKAERNVLAEVRHHSVVRLWYSFQDEEHLYLVRPTVLKRKSRLTPHSWVWGGVGWWARAGGAAGGAL